MQGHARVRRQTNNVAGIRGNFRLKQYKVQHGRFHHLGKSGRIAEYLL